jgi:Xaa-Pro aminopeptidase
MIENFLTSKLPSLAAARTVEKRLSSALSFASSSSKLSKKFANVSEADLAGFAASEQCAWQAATEVAGMLQPGMTEKRASQLLKTYLADCGVSSYFHAPFVWFGRRTSFYNVKNYAEYQPSDSRLSEGDPYILDVAPIVKGYVSDIGYFGCFGKPRPEVELMRLCLDRLYHEIPVLMSSCSSALEVMDAVDALINEFKLRVVHNEYPFSVLGHRVIKTSDIGGSIRFLNFGWQAFSGFLKSGGTAQLFNRDYRGSLDGLWALEPHIALGEWGAKFEFLYLKSPEYSGWLRDCPESI